MRVITERRHVQRVDNADARLLILENRVDEVAAEVPVRTAVPAGFDSRRKSGLEDRISELLNDFLSLSRAGIALFERTIRRVESTDFASDATGFKVGSLGFAVHDARKSPFFRVEKRDFRNERVANLVWFGLFKRIDSTRANVDETLVGHADVIGARVGGIPQRRAGAAPVSVGADRGRAGRRGMVVFAFRIDQPPEPSGFVDFFHRVEVVVERGGFKHRVLEPPILFNTFEQPLSLFRLSIVNRHGVTDVLAMFKAEDAVARMGRRVGRQKDRFDRIVFNHLLKGRIGLLALNAFGERGATVGEQIRNGDDLHVRMVLEIEFSGELTDAITNEPDSELAVGIGAPFLMRIVFRPGKVEAGDFGRLFVAVRGGTEKIGDEGRRRYGA